jgi:hypothetical protein
VKTSVIFRVFHSGGDVIAIFPFEPNDVYGHSCMSYQHIGQHGGASTEIMRGHYTRQATPEESASLRLELERAGYQLREMKRIPTNAFEVRRQAIASARGEVVA